MSQIKIDHVTHWYDRLGDEPLTVLEGINLELKANKLTAIVGTSGCGKSTLLKMIAGLLRPTQGRLLLGDTEITGTDRSRGMVFQQDAVFPWMTVAKNISYGPKLRGASQKERAEIEAKWIDLVGLKGFENAWPRELSGGMRKRVDLGRVYANDPDVLLMDEPFGALDVQTKERMQSELQKLWELTQKTIVFVTHDLEEAIFLADQIIVMSARPGRVRHIEDVNLPRPRTAETRLTEEVLTIKRKLWHMLEH